MVLFHTSRLLIRQFTPKDEEDFYRVNGDPDVMRYIRPVKSREACAAYLQEQLSFYRQNPLLGRWSVYEQASGLFVGSAALIPVENTEDIQLGYALLPPYWGRGYATELARGTISFFFREFSKEVLWAFVLPDNTASALVLRKCGFQPAGKVQEGGKEVLRFTLSAEAYKNEINGRPGHSHDSEA